MGWVRAEFELTCGRAPPDPHRPALVVGLLGSKAAQQVVLLRRPRPAARIPNLCHRILHNRLGPPAVCFVGVDVPRPLGRLARQRSLRGERLELLELELARLLPLKGATELGLVQAVDALAAVGLLQDGAPRGPVDYCRRILHRRRRVLGHRVVPPAIAVARVVAAVAVV
eukprot:scaffold31867_cov50-Phaeocystis_antarctica.AAC.3